jgi:hypothetical protein
MAILRMLLPVRRKNPPKHLSPNCHLPRSVARHQIQFSNPSKPQNQLLQQNLSLNLQFCLNFLKFPKSQLIAQGVHQLTKSHPLKSQSDGTNPLLFLKSLLFLKLLHLSLVVEAGGAEAEAEAVAVVDEDEVVVVDEVPPHSAAAAPLLLVLLPLQRAVVEFEAEAAVVVEPETLPLLSYVHSMIVEST